MKRYGHKYNAVRVERNGRRYDSKLEAAYAEYLDWRKAAGEVVFYLEQVPFRLAGGIRYVVDFLVFEAGGNCRFVDVKGMETPTFRNKMKLVAEAYPEVEIEIVKRVPKWRKAG